MHELGLARGIVELASSAAAEAAATRVTAVHIAVGRLAGIEPGALLFSYDLAAEGTVAAGSTLVITEIPVTIWCPTCNAERELPGIQRFRCPECDTPSGQIRRGKELEVSSIEVES